MGKERVDYGYWNNIENLRNEAEKYNSKSSFQRGNPAAYKKARILKVLENVCSNMRGGRTKWTKELVQKEALLYDTRTKFGKNSNSAYVVATKNGWLDEVCSHMKIIGSLKKRAIYAYEFPDNYVYVGLTYNIDKRNTEHTETGHNSAVKNHIQETGNIPSMVILTGYIPVEQAIIQEGEILEKYKLSDWNILNRVKAGALGGATLIWTREAIVEEASKYTTRKDFVNNAGGAYYRAVKEGILPEVSSHMTRSMKWNKENCIDAALECKNKKEFQAKFPGAFSYARKTGIFKAVTAHMVSPKINKNGWTEDSVLLEASKYSSSNAFRAGNQSAYYYARKHKLFDKMNFKKKLITKSFKDFK